MKYNPILEIISILNLDNTDKELLNNIDYITKELNFQLGNIKNKSIDSYQKEIDIDDKKILIKLKNLNKKNQLEIIYQQNSNYISLKYENNEINLNNLRIMYPHGLYILDDNKKYINYYDKKTIDYVIEKEQKTKGTCFIEQREIQENGLLPEESLYLPDDNLERIQLFKNLIKNTKEENEILLEKMKKNTKKKKVLIKI